MDKIKLGIIFGGMSSEHDVSISSGISIINNLDKEKYNVFPIYISKQGEWYEYKAKTKKYKIGRKIKNIDKIDNIINYVQNLDVVFPVLHGLYGEDGTVQGLLELLNVPYVGCKVLASSIGMDKVYSKIIFEKAGIKQAKYEYIRHYKNYYIYIDKNFNETIYNIEEICNVLQGKLNFPMFVKPSNSGSSVGINKAKTLEELKRYIEIASQFDNKILIEENIQGREIECSVLGIEDVKASCLGEILPDEEFYTYNSKYINSKTKLNIPANLSEELTNKVRKEAIKAFKAIDGKGYARVDFMVNYKTGEINIIEINTIPGFTNISMYPKLWEESGLKYPNLLEELINLAIEEKQNNKRS